jgi:hypothetical protein
MCAAPALVLVEVPLCERSAKGYSAFLPRRSTPRDGKGPVPFVSFSATPCCASLAGA